MKKAVFAFLTFLFLLLIVFILESVLLLFDYGDRLNIFKENKALPDYFLINENLGKRYFPNLQTSPLVSPDLILKNKPENSLRVFIFGGSSAAGYPYFYNGSFSRMIKDRLEDMYPGKLIEIMNLAMPAVNSYTVLDLAKESIPFKPDLFLIYTGHNEFYGALGSGSSEGLFLNRNLIQLYLTLQHFRSFQLLRNSIVEILNLFKEKIDEQSIKNRTLMERMVRDQIIPYNSDLYHKTHQNFKENIMELIELAQDNEIDIFLGELVSNIRDQKPFISKPDSISSEAFNFSSLIQDELIPDAIKDSLKNFATEAALHYKLAQYLERLKRYSEAKKHYYLAKDFDCLRFRASEDLNLILKNISRESQAAFVPVSSYMERKSPEGIIGNNLMVDHLHPDIEGNFLIAKAFADAIQLLDLHTISTKSDSFYRDRIALTEVDVICAEYRIQALLAGWPFQKESQVDQVIKSFKPKRFIEKVALDLWENRISWYDAHKTMAITYASKERWNLAESEYKALAKGRPFDNIILNDLAHVLIVQKKYSEAKVILQKSIDIKPSNFAYRMLGSFNINDKQLDQGIELLEKAIALDSNDTQSLYNLAGAYLLKKEKGKSKQILQQLLKINPNYEQAKELLLRIK